jgi:hypothetical protein
VLNIDLKICAKREWSFGKSASAGSDMNLVKFPPSLSDMKSKGARDALTCYRVTAVLDPPLDYVMCALALRLVAFWSDCDILNCIPFRHILTFNVEPVLLRATQLAVALWYRRVLFLYCLSYKLMNSQQSPLDLKVSFHMREVHHIALILSGNCPLLLPVGSPRRRPSYAWRSSVGVGVGWESDTITTHIFLCFLSSI